MCIPRSSRKTTVILPSIRSSIQLTISALRWYHFFYGPLLWRRAAPPPPPEGARHVPDYRVYDRDDEHKEPATQTPAKPVSEGSTVGEGAPLETNLTATSQEKDKDIESAPLPSLSKGKSYASALEDLEKDDHKIEGAIILPRNLWILFRYKLPKMLLHGTSGKLHIFLELADIANGNQSIFMPCNPTRARGRRAIG